MIQMTLKGAWRRKRRLAGAGIAVVLGVAFLAATLTLTDTMRTAFDRLFTDANEGIDVVVRDATAIGTEDNRRRGVLDGELAAVLAEVPGVRTVEPFVEGVAQIESSDGRGIGGNGPPTVGESWVSDPELTPWRLADGRPPELRAAGAERDLVEVVIDRRTAGEADLAVGDRTIVRAPAPIPVEVVGIATFGELDSLGPTTFAAFHVDIAAELFAGAASAPGPGGADATGGGGGVSRFLIAGDAEVAPETLRDAVAGVIPPGAEALTGAELTEEMLASIESDFLGFVEIFLLVFAVIALLVAAISIANTFAVLVAQRSREWALVRAVGATRGQVVGSTLIESIAVGFVASLLGLGAGYGLGLGARWLMAQSGMALPGSGLVVSTTTVVIALGTGVVVTALAGLAPALRAARVRPVEAMRDAAIDRATAPFVRGVVGLVGVVGGAAMVALASRNGDAAMATAGIGAAVLVLSWLVAAPVAVRPLMWLASAMLARVRGTTGRIAGRNTARNPRRTTASAAALLVGTTVAALFTTVAASITASVGDVVDRTFGGDLVISPESFSGAMLPPELAGAVEALDEVDVVAPLAVAAMLVDGYEEPIASDPGRLAAVLELGAVDGSIADLRPGQFAASMDEAERRDWQIGDVVLATVPGGHELPLEVALLFEERQIVGDVVVHIDDWRPHSSGGGDVALLLGLADGIDSGAGAAAVDAVGATFSAPSAQTRDQFVDDVAGEVQTLLAIVYALLGLAVLIALMGIANSLALAVHERRAELGLLRAIGQTRSQLRSTVRWESVLTSVLGAVPGVGIGAFLGWGLVRAVEVQEGLGSFSVPVGTLGVLVALAVLAGALAAVRPARRAARLDVIGAMSDE